MPLGNKLQPTTEQRVMEVLTLLDKGARTCDIYVYGKDAWGIEERQIDNYIHVARKILGELSEEDRKTKYVRMVSMKLAAIRKGEKLLHEATAYRDKVNALRVLNEIQTDLAKLYGLYIDRVIIDDRREAELNEEALKLLKAKEIPFEEVKGDSEYGT